MADIKQAAKWMQEGKRVRRPSWPRYEYLEANGDDRPVMYWRRFKESARVPCLRDLLADDWEIAD